MSKMLNPSAELSALFRPFDQPDAPGASVMVIRQGQACFARGFGHANLENKTECDLKTNFRLASVTKQFTAMAILILAQKRRIRLEESLTDLFAEFPAYGRHVKVRHLLSHTSGLLDYEELIPPGTQIPVSDRDVLRLLMRQPATYFAPGTRFRYSNSAYALLALAAEARSGETFAHFLQQNIFLPLGMPHTLAYEAGLSRIVHRAYGYSGVDAGFERTDQSLTSSVLGDGGIYSSVKDLFHWDQALENGRILRPNLLRRAFQPATPTEDPNTNYGFGWYLGCYRGMKENWHSGNTLGFTTRIARFPDQRFTVIILANRNEAPIAELPHQIVDICLKKGVLTAGSEA